MPKRHIQSTEFTQPTKDNADTTTPMTTAQSTHNTEQSNVSGPRQVTKKKQQKDFWLNSHDIGGQG